MIDWQSASSLRSTALAGRELREQCLLEAYQRRTSPDAPRELVIITGSSGMGKTVLARSLERRAEAERGYFCWGKCDQMQHNDPFAPFNAAVTHLVETVLARDDTGEETVRLEEAIEAATKDSTVSLTQLTSLFSVFHKVIRLEAEDHASSALGLENSEKVSNGSLLSISTQMHPKQQQVQQQVQRQHPGASMETPAMVVFCKFLRAFCCIQHPIVMLLDDWQWLDTSSLELLKLLGTIDSIPGFMILGTCRGNEVSVNDPLSVLLRSLEDQNVKITDIQLHGLSLQGTQDMIANMLQIPKRESVRTLRLAELVHSLTRGNPFFVRQYVRVFYDNQLLWCNNGSWNFNEEALVAATRAPGGYNDDDDQVHDKVSEDGDGYEGERTRMLNAEIRKLADLSLAMKETLTIASFLGAAFSLHHLDAVATSALADIKNALVVLVQQGIVQQQKQQQDACCYRWTHDRFQQSASSLIAANQRRTFSVNVGRQLLSKLPPGDFEEHPFLVANLFLQDLNVLKEQAERTKVATLLHLAGKKAAASSAFESAGSFFLLGISLLPQKPWQNEYDLCLALHNGAMEMECCVGRFDQADRLYVTVLENTKGLADQVRAYEVKISSLSSRHQDKDACFLGFNVLKRLGEPFTNRPTKFHSIVAIANTAIYLRRTPTEEILKVKPMERWDKLAALKILQIIAAPVMRDRPEFSPLCFSRGVKISIKYGFSCTTPFMFVGMGMVLGTAAVGLPHEAKRCASLAHMIDQRYHAPENMARIFACDYGYVQWWHMPFRSCLPQLFTPVKAGLQSGDVESGFIAAAFYCMYGFCTGIRLEDHIAAMEEQYREFSRLKQKMAFVGLNLELAKRLTQSDGGTDLSSEASLFGTYCDQETGKDEIKSGRKDESLLIVSNYCQLFQAVHTGNYKQGLLVAHRLCRLPFDQMYSVASTVQIYFLFGMTEILAARATSRKRWLAGTRALRKLKSISRIMTCRENVVNKIYLLEAERAALNGEREKARRKFADSILYAEESGFLHEGALAYERYASALLDWGDIEGARANRRQSAILYREWGFLRKAAHLSDVGEVERSSQ